MITVYIDGACEPTNPGGAMGMGVRCEEPFISQSQWAPPGPGNSNNVAEYRALVLALELLEPYQEKEIEIRSDSLLLMNQIRGTWQVHPKGLYAPWYAVAQAKAAKFQDLRFKWVPREQNEEADRLSKEILRANWVEVREGE